MSESILNSVKKVLGVASDYTAFDTDIIMHINSAFSTLCQLGVGPVEGYMIEDSNPTWDNFLLNDVRLNFVKQYVYYKVRLAFDPPATSALLTSITEQIKELEWRINVAVDPVSVGEIIYDGGVP